MFEMNATPMDPTLLLEASLGLALAMTIGFFVLASKMGLLRAFGRHALPWKTLGIASIAAIMPAVVTIASVLLAEALNGKVGGAGMAIMFASLGGLGHAIMVSLYRWQQLSMQEAETIEAPEVKASESSSAEIER